MKRLQDTNSSRSSGLLKARLLGRYIITVACLMEVNDGPVSDSLISDLTASCTSIITVVPQVYL
jgi:hypothetical protein